MGLDAMNTYTLNSGTLNSGRRDGSSHRINLVGDSLIQFLSFALPREALAAVRRSFYEDGAGADAVLQGFADGAILPPDLAARTVVVNGEVAADTFLGEWLPVPFLRRAASEHAASQADAGPSNWARLQIVSDGRDLRVIFAFDTSLGDASDPSARADVMPMLTDANDGKIFRFASEIEDIEAFISEPWVDDWIAAPPTHRPQTNAEPQGLARLAHFMTLLAAVRAVVNPPDAVLVGSASGRASSGISTGAPHTDVVLSLAFGTGDVTGHLIDVARFDEGVSSAITPLAVRNFERPWITEAGCMPSAVAFKQSAFGREALSRLSGRMHAFAWPSLVRIGHDARSTSAQLSPDAPLSGMADVLDGLLDHAPNDAVWRFARANAQGRLPFVSGSGLALLTESGERVAHGAGRTPATRARFCASTLLSLAVQELVAHAIAAANQADLAPANAPRAARRLRTVMVSLPDSMHTFEVERAQARVRDGVALAFDALGWPDNRRPDVVFAPGRAKALQYAYLHNEIAHRLGGRAPAYLRLLAGPVRPARTPVSIASLDLGTAGLSLTISGVTSSDDTHLALRPIADDCAGLGFADVQNAVAREIIVPALAKHFEKARLANATRFLERVLHPPADATAAEQHMAARLFRDTILPAARGVLALHYQTNTTNDRASVETTLRVLIGAQTDFVAIDRLQSMAVAEGANATSTLDAVVMTSAADVRAHIDGHLGPAIRAACRIVRRHRCSALLISGPKAALDIMRESALGEASVAPDRLIDMGAYRFAAWIGASGDMSSAEAAGGHLALQLAETHEPQAHAETSDPGLAGIHFGLHDGAMADRVPLFSDPKRASGNAADQTHTFHFSGEARRVGIARIDVSQWPMRPLAIIEVADIEAIRRAVLPLAVTIGLQPQTPLSPQLLQIRSVRDARGRQLPPTVLDVKVATRRVPDMTRDDGRQTHLSRGGHA
jgi:hypothetical protein